MRAAALVAALVVVAGGCKIQTEEAVPPNNSASSGLAALPVDAAITYTSDEFIAAAMSRATPPFVVMDLELAYVRADGTFDVTYGTASAMYAYRVVPPADDPKRPIGAPVERRAEQPPPSECPRLTLGRNGLVSDPTMVCMDLGGIATPPTCNAQKLWQRAIADGAPANGLATLKMGAVTDTPVMWSFAIDDEPRNLHFQRTYDDAGCASLPAKPVPAEAGEHVFDTPTRPPSTRPMTASPEDCDEVTCVLENYERPCCENYKRNSPRLPSRPSPSDVPQALERHHITSAVDKSRAKIGACAKQGEGTVKVRVKVKPNGTPEKVEILETPNASIGECVAKVARSWKFQGTREGGSFSMPFTL